MSEEHKTESHQFNLSAYGSSHVPISITNSPKLLNNIQMSVISKEKDSSKITYRLYRYDKSDVLQGYPYNVDEYTFDLKTKRIIKVKRPRDHWVQMPPFHNKKVFEYKIYGESFFSYMRLNDADLEALSNIFRNSYTSVRKRGRNKATQD